MKTKRLWSTIVVSFICILLASSFVLQTSAETIETIASLQGATVVDVVIPEGFEGEQADHEYVSDVTVTEETDYFEGSLSKGKLYSATQSIYGVPVAFEMDGVSQVYFNTSTGAVTVFENGAFRSFSIDYRSTILFVNDNYYVAYDSGAKVFTHDNTLVYTAPGTGMSIDAFYFTQYGDYFYLFFSYYSNRSRVLDCQVIDSSWNFVAVYSVANISGSYNFSFFRSGSLVFCHRYNTPVIFDLSTFRSTAFSYSSIASPAANRVSCFVGDYLYLFATGKYTYYRCDIDFDSKIITTTELSYPISFSPSFSSYTPSVGVVGDSVYIPSTGNFLQLSPDKNYYYNMIDYSTATTFVPDRYLNFSYLSDSGGTANGGGYVGFELDFGVPDYFYENNEVTAFRFECMVGSYSNDSETFEGGIPPLTVDVVGGDNWLPVLNGKMVKKVGDIYLWAFTCLVYTSNDGPITSLNITLNQYIPLQTETHSFSLPCSALTLERWQDTSSAIEDIKGDIVIIGNQIGQTNERLDEIQNILTSLPDDHESNMQEWSNDLNNNQSRLDDISSAIDDEKSVYDDLVSQYDPYISAPDIDPSIENNASEMIDKVTSLDSGEAADLFSFIRDLWTVHPYMLGMSSIVVVLGILGIYVRSA